MPASTTNPRTLRQQRKIEARRRQRWLDFYRAVLATKEGRFVFADLILVSGANKSAWNPSGSEIFRNIGRQEIGLMLKETLREADEDAFVLMEREQRSLALRDAHEDDKLTDDSEASSGNPPAPGTALTEEPDL